MRTICTFVLFLVRLTQSYEIKTSTTSLSKKTGEQAFFYCELTLADEDEDTIDNLKDSWNGFTRNDVKDDRQQLKTYAKTKSIKTTIKFKDPQEADSGEYVCKYKDKSSSVKVQFLQPIKFTESPDDPDFTKVLVKGKDDKVTCQATPDGLKYSWRKPDGETVESQSFDVNLETDDLSGSYECSVAREEDGSIQVLSYTFDVQFPPEVTLESPDLTDGQIVKTAGESFSLTCTVSAKPEATIKWLRDSVEIADTANKTTISMESTTFADHNGKYECQASNAHGTNSGSATVTIVELPVVTIKESKSESLKVNENEKIQLTCSATGKPEPDVFEWTFPDGTTSAEPTQNIDSAAAEHNGKFICKAWNQVNGQKFEPGQAEIVVDVQYSPKLKTGETLYAVEGKKSDLTCQFDGNPRPEVTWEEDTEKVAKSNDVGDFGKESVWTVDPPEFKTLTCVGKNALSTEKKTIEIAKASPPDKPEIPTVEPAYNTASLSWTKPRSDPGIPIIAYIITYTETGGTNKETTIDDPSKETVKVQGLKDDTEYTFSIIAENAAGKSEASDTATVKTLEIAKPKLSVKSNSTDGTKWTVAWSVDEVGADSLKKFNIKYIEINSDGTEIGTWQEKDIDISATNENYSVDDKKGNYTVKGLKAGSTYKVEVSISNDKQKSDPSSLTFTVPIPAGARSTGTVVGVMVAVIIILLLFVDISCYYMKQGGLIMTCQRALCAESEDKGEPATADQRADEKVPLAPDNV